MAAPIAGLVGIALFIALLTSFNYQKHETIKSQDLLEGRAKRNAIDANEGITDILSEQILSTQDDIKLETHSVTLPDTTTLASSTSRLDQKGTEATTTPNDVTSISEPIELISTTVNKQAQNALESTGSDAWTPTNSFNISTKTNDTTVITTEEITSTNSPEANTEIIDNRTHEISNLSDKHKATLILKLLNNDSNYVISFKSIENDELENLTTNENVEITTVAYSTPTQNISIKEETKTINETGINTGDQYTTNHMQSSTTGKLNKEHDNTKQPIEKTTMSVDANSYESSTVNHKDVTVEEKSTTVVNHYVQTVNTTDNNTEQRKNGTTTTNDNITTNKPFNATSIDSKFGENPSTSLPKGENMTNTTTNQIKKLPSSDHIIYSLLRQQMREQNYLANQQIVYNALAKYIEEATKLINATLKEHKLDPSKYPNLK